ncbi:MAG: glycosyltransferase family 1 protein [Phycisphaeraceae bacterium]|nr:MAG: glycosyltransferase family 1 protein [Phycisphaeraceae bacterium]
MNRLVSVNLKDVAPDRLPPGQRTGPVRMLFISSAFLGFGEYYKRLVEYTDQRDDIDAVHIKLNFPLWNKILGKSLPFHTRGWDFHSHRHLIMWRWILRRWLLGPLDVSRFDVVHIMTQGVALAMVDVKPKGSAKFALNIDGTAAGDVADFGYSSLARAPFIRAERRMFNEADLIACRNSWAARSLKRDYGVPESRVHIARSGVRPPERSRADSPPTPAGDPVRIAFVGNAWARKGGPILLKIHQRRFADRAELHVIGNAPQEASARNVVWRGRVPNQELVGELLPSMDMFVLPTKIDQLPRAILEAAAAGLPVISTHLAGIPEVVLDGETGLLCPQGDWQAVEEAMERMIEDPAGRIRMGRAAREHMKSLCNPDRTFNELLDRLVGLAGAGSDAEAERPIAAGAGGSV